MVALLNTRKSYEIQIPESTSQLLLGSHPHSFIDMLSVTVFVLPNWGRSPVVLRSSVGPAAQWAVTPQGCGHSSVMFQVPYP